MLKSISIWLPVAGLLLNGCIHSYYLPNSNHVPLLTEKKDARILVNYQSSSGEILNAIPVFELQGSYAIGNHLGVTSSFLNAARKIDTASSRFRYGDIGIGYFVANKSKNLVAECYGGFGWGFAENGFYNGATSRAELTKLFIQPAIGYTSRYFDAAVSLRIGSVHHSSMQSQGAIPDPEIREFESLSDHPSHIVWEPAMIFRFGDGPFKLQIQIGLSDSDTHRSRFYSAVGLFVSLPFKKQLGK